MLSPKSSISHVELRVRGMTCASCSGAIKTALKQKCGIESVQVDLIAGKVQIEIDRHAITTKQQIREVIESAGFKVLENTLTDWREQLRLLQAEEAEERAEEIQNLKKVALFAIPLIVLGHAHIFTAKARNLALLLLSLPLHLWAARSIYQKAWKSANMERLTAISSLAALLASLDDLFFFAGFDSEHSLIDCSAIVLLTSVAGKVIEGRLRASFAQFGMEFLCVPGFVYGPNLPFCRLEAVQVDSVICVGSAVAKTIPFDGEIVDGWVRVNESMLNGEARPVLKERKALVLAGSSVIEGRALLQVKRTFNESLLSLIARGSLNSFSAGRKNSALIDEIARFFTPLILALAGACAAVWSLIFFVSGARADELIIGWHSDSALLAVLHFTLATLTVACPCALSLASPMAVAAAKISAKRKGIVLNNAAVLQTAPIPSQTTLLFDKTGTLTQGRPIIRYEHKSVETLEGKILELVLEAESSHALKSTLAQSIIEYCKSHERETLKPTIKSSQLILGKGIEAEFQDGSKLAIFKSGNFSGSEVWIDGNLVGCFTWRDDLRPEAQQVLQLLRAKGFQMGIVSGDAQEAVDDCARACGWDLFDYRVGDCDPFAKQRFVQSVHSLSKRRIIFIGDGINDALAQSCSSLAISLNPYAASTASLTLLRPDLSLIVEAFRIGRMLRIQIVMNLLAASIYNLLMLPWAMGFGLAIGLPPLSPRITSILMATSGLSLMFSNLLTFAK